MSKHPNPFLLVALACAPFTFVRAESASAVSGPPTAKATLTFNVTDEPTVYFDAWSALGRFEGRGYTIDEGLMGFEDLQHSQRLSNAYGVPQSPAESRYFKVQTYTSSWSSRADQSGHPRGDSGNITVVMRKRGSGNIEVTGTWTGTSYMAWQDAITHDEYGGGVGPWYTETATTTATARPTLYAGGPQFDITTVSNMNSPGSQDQTTTGTGGPPNFVSRDSVPQSLYPYRPDPWTASDAVWHIAIGDLNTTGSLTDIHLSMSEEDTPDTVLARVGTDMSAASLDTIPWGIHRVFRDATEEYEYNEATTNLWLEKYTVDEASTGDYYEEHGQVRFNVPQSLRIPGLALRGRVVQTFRPSGDYSHPQLIKIFDVVMHDGQWQSPAIDPVPIAQDGYTILSAFSPVAELIAPHKIISLPQPASASATTPAEYSTKKPVLSWVSQANDANGNAVISRQQLVDSYTLQQINLSDARQTFGQFSTAKVTWTVLSDATAQVRLWVWTDDGSPLGVWKLLAPSDDLKPYYGSTTQFVFAEALSGGQATIRLTIDVNGQQVSDDILINSASVSLAVDANRDGQIALSSEDSSDATSADKPYRFWINDDFDDLYGGRSSEANYKNTNVDGPNDLKDFAPVFLDIQQLVNALPPSSSVRYLLKQADGALNFVYTNKTRELAFTYRNGSYVGCGPNFDQPASSAPTTQITATGVELTAQFLSNIKTDNKGVILIEGRMPSSAPLMLIVEKDGVKVAEASLPLSIGPRILLLLHGMNSYTGTWDAFVANVIGPTINPHFQDIVDGDFFGPLDPPPKLTAGGVRCYRLQFGSLENSATAREGLESLRASNAQGGVNGVNRDYLPTPILKCGDFETFDELAQEVDNAIKILLDRHPNAQIVLVGHSRGGLAGRKFLESASPRRSAVVGFLITSSPQQGSRMGRIYQWLQDHPREPGGPLAQSDDWLTVDFLRDPTLFGIGKPTLDVRRPVILDVSDQSAAITTLNNPALVANLPAGIIYGEIINSRIELGVLSLGLTGYSTFHDDRPDAFIKLSTAAEAYVLGSGQVPTNFPGDGLIPQNYQVFTQLPGFPAPGYPPTSATGQNTIPRLLVSDRDLVHTDAPNQYEDIRSRLRLMAPGWFP